MSAMKWTRVQNGHYRGKSAKGIATAERGSETGLWWWHAEPSVGRCSGLRKFGQKTTLADAMHSAEVELGKLVS